MKKIESQKCIMTKENEDQVRNDQTSIYIYAGDVDSNIELQEK